MRVLVPFSTGVEEIEFVAVVDILRRAGADVVTAGLGDLEVVGRSHIKIVADAMLGDVLHQAWDMVVLPGGLPNAYHLRDHVELKHLVQQVWQQGIVGAICAAPLALAAYGLTQDKKVTSYPAIQSVLSDMDDRLIYQKQAVVVDGNLISSQGAGTAVEFALVLVKVLFGSEKATIIREEIVA